MLNRIRNKRIELRAIKDFSSELVETLKIFGYSINEIKEIWIHFEEDDKIGKYGYYFPKLDIVLSSIEPNQNVEYYSDYDCGIDNFSKDTSFDLLSLNSIIDCVLERQSVEEKDNSNTMTVASEEGKSHSLFDDMFDEGESEDSSSGGLLDDIIDREEYIHDTLVWLLNKEKDEIPQRINDVYRPVVVKHLEKEAVYDVLTSAEWHRKITFLNSHDCEHGHTSYIRMSELTKLFDFDIPHPNMENFAIDLGHIILYFHMDNGQGGFENIHFNHYRYNDQLKGEMKFFNKDNVEIVYDEWESLIKSKPVLVFGYSDIHVKCGMPLYCTEPALVFLGTHVSYTTNANETGDVELSM